MQVVFTDEQEQLRDAVRRFLAERSPTEEARRLMATKNGFDPALWRQLCQDLALAGVHVPEAYGGQGFSAVELGIVLEEMGRALLCAPYFSSTVLAATAILNAGSEQDKQELLPAICNGERLATLAITEPNGRWDLAGIELLANGDRLQGVKSHVVDGCLADLLIVAARSPASQGDDGLSLYAVDAAAAGIARRPLTALDATRKLARIEFNDVPARRLGDEGAAGAALAKTLQLAAIALANEMIGGAQRLLESAVEYAKLRLQFGRAIGSFQAVKHRCADLLLTVELAKSAAYRAAGASAEASDSTAALASLAKASAADAYMQAAKDCIQIHGGIGFTWDNDTHLWYKRAKSSEAFLGDAAYHRELLMRQPFIHQVRRSASAPSTPSAAAPADDEARRVREEVRAWLAANWSAEQSLVAWRNKLADSGWGMPTWPAQWFGRDLPQALAPVVEEEFARANAVGVAKTGIRLLAAATLLAHGNDEQKAKYLRRILTGEDTWCQLFSEPGSGSDLAGASSRADFDGKRWIVNGQKVWTTSAHHADYGLLLARTDWDAPKHQGLTYFILDMRQPGVEVRPLRQMNGHASFNQVFFTDAAIPPENQVSAIGNGWQVAITTLAHERRAADGIGRSHERQLNGRIYAEEREETATALEPYKWYPQRAGRVDLVVERALASGKIDDPAARQEIAKLLTMASAADWTAQRARAAQEQGRPQGPEGSLGKLAGSDIARLACHVHTLIAGADAMLGGDDGALDGLIAEILLSVPATSIAGGTDEIQRNIIAERVLGMPKEPRMDSGPFRDVKRN